MSLDKVGVDITAKGAEEATRKVNEFKKSVGDAGTQAEVASKGVEKNTKSMEHHTMGTKQAVGALTGLASASIAVGFAIGDLDKKQLAVTKSARLVEESEQKVAKALATSGKNSQAYADAQRDLSIAQEQLRIKSDDVFQSQVAIGLQFATLASSLIPNAIKAFTSLTASKVLDTTTTNVNTAAKSGNTVALVGNTGATLANSAATTASSVSMWRLNISMLANPLFAIPTAIAIAGAIALVATNQFGLRDALFGSAVAMDKNTVAMDAALPRYDHMGNLLKDNSGAMVGFTHELEVNTSVLNKNSDAVERNVRGRQNLKKKNDELAAQARNEFLNPSWGITTLDRGTGFKITDSQGREIPQGLLGVEGAMAQLWNNSTQRTINPKTGEGMIKTYDSKGNVLFWQSDTGTYYNTKGNVISSDQVSRILNKGRPSAGGASSAFDFIADPLTGTIKAIPKGLGGKNIHGSINEPANNYGQNSAWQRKVGLQGAAADIAAKIRAASMGSKLLSAHLDPSVNSRLGGQGSLGSIVSSLGKAGINLAGSGFGRGTVASQGGGRKKGKGRGNLNIRIVSNMIQDLQKLAQGSLSAIVSSGLADFLTDSESSALIAMVNSAGSSVRSIQNSRASRGVYDSRAAYMNPRSAAAASERAGISSRFKEVVSFLTERKGRFEHEQAQNARTLGELEKESQYASGYLKASKDEILAVMGTPEGARDIRGMLAFMNIPLYRSIGTA